MSNATHVAKIEETVARQRAFFQTGATRPVAVRVAALKRLKKEIQAREQILLDALQADLHKSHFEGYMCELGLNLDELGYLARHVAEWSRPRRRPTPQDLLPWIQPMSLLHSIFYRGKSLERNI